MLITGSSVVSEAGSIAGTTLLIIPTSTRFPIICTTGKTVQLSRVIRVPYQRMPYEKYFHLSHSICDRLALVTIYYDMSAAAHAHPGLGRYADSLGRALLQAHGESMALFYYGDETVGLPPGLEGVPSRAAVAGRKRWRLQVWFGHL